MLSSSSIVLCRYLPPCPLPGKWPLSSKSPNRVLRLDEKVGGDSSKMVSMGGPRLPELLRVVRVGKESYTVSLWLSVLLYPPMERCSLSDPTVDVISDWVAEMRPGRNADSAWDEGGRRGSSGEGVGQREGVSAEGESEKENCKDCGVFEAAFGRDSWGRGSVGWLLLLLLLLLRLELDDE